MDETAVGPLVDPLKDQRDDVFRKIGRNLILFQQVEAALKGLLSASSIEGATTSDVDAYVARRRETIEKKTLGTLVGQFTEEILAASPDHEDSCADARNPLIRIKTSFRIEGDAYYEQKKGQLAALVKERNELVHHSLSLFDLRSTDGIARFGQHLDEQANRFRTELCELKTTLDSMTDVFQAMGSFFASNEGIKLSELIHLQNSPIVAALAEIADEIARPDGWSLLALAGGHLRKRAPDLAESYRERYGYKSLSSLLVASEMFQVKEEHLNNGHHRVVYRPKPQ